MGLSQSLPVFSKALCSQPPRFSLESSVSSSSGLLSAAQKTGSKSLSWKRKEYSISFHSPASIFSHVSFTTLLCQKMFTLTSPSFLCPPLLSSKSSGSCSGHTKIISDDHPLLAETLRSLSCPRQPWHLCWPLSSFLKSCHLLSTSCESGIVLRALFRLSCLVLMIALL